MYQKMLDTWTVFVFLLVIFSEFCLGLPVSNVSKPKNMFEAVIQRCPRLENSKLNSSKIFKEQCVDWETINKTSSFSSETKSNVECLLYYESLLTFCTKFNSVPIDYTDLLPTSKKVQDTVKNYNISKLCLENDLYPKNQFVEHNISGIIQSKSDCFLLCTDYTPSRVSDICRYSFYLAHMDPTELLKSLKKIPLGAAIAGATSDAQNPIKKKPGTVVGKVDETLSMEPLKGSNIPVSKPQKLEHSEVITGDQSEKSPNVSQVGVDASKVDNNVGQEDHNANKDVGAAKTAPAKISSDDESHHRVEDNEEKHIPNPAQPPVKLAESPQKVPSSNIGNSADKKPDNTPLKSPNNENQKEDKNDDVEETIEDFLQSPDSGTDGNSQTNVEWEEDKAELEQEAENTRAEIHKEPSQARKVKPDTVEEDSVNAFNTQDEDEMNGDSYFFSYFMVLMCLFIICYIGYHNRQKVLALILEGKRGRRPGRSRRPNSANYHKLDSNLEEAISSNVQKSHSNIIY